MPGDFPLPNEESWSPACVQDYASSHEWFAPSTERCRVRKRKERLSLCIVKVCFFVQQQGRIRCILDREEEKKRGKKKATQALIVPLSHSNHRIVVKIMLAHCASNRAIYLFRRRGQAQSSLMRLPPPQRASHRPATPVYRWIPSLPFPSSPLEKEH